MGTRNMLVLTGYYKHVGESKRKFTQTRDGEEYIQGADRQPWAGESGETRRVQMQEFSRLL